MRIQGITIDDKKQLQYSLTALYGIGIARARHICNECSVDYTKSAGDLSQKEEMAIRKVAEDFKLEGDLRREVSQNVKRLKDIKAYRGVRHSRGLPTKGQRTKTNSRTVRGNKRSTMGSGRRKVEKT